ncbi:phosphonate C-P lyase system protein PhnG [Rhodovibrio salinarum]|nr:phosphonate C-P lyase system protein PhnG [Rhodovibrio salinarum]
MSASPDTHAHDAGIADPGVPSSDPVARRQRWMGALAKADPGQLAGCWSNLPALPDWQRLRAPETGMVMTRGRIGGDGRRFNLGEITITRCTVRIVDGTADGIAGHAYVMGRDKTHAERAAVLDALLQDPAWADRLEAVVIRPLLDAAAARRAAAARKAGATKVNFTTVTRGDD